MHEQSTQSSAHQHLKSKQPSVSEVHILNIKSTAFQTTCMTFHLQSGDGECLPATQLYLSIFTCPTQRVKRQEVKVMQEVKRMPARCSRPDNLTISSLLLDEAYPYDTASIELPSDAGENLPGRQTYLFHPAAGKAYPTTLPVDCEAFQALNFTLLSVSPDLPTDAGESTPGQTILPFQVPLSARLTRPTPWFPVGRRRPSQSLPARQTHLFHQLAKQYRTLHTWSVKQS